MAHKKGGGTSRNGRDTAGKRLGVKVFAGEFVGAGGIIVRQRGTKFYPSMNTGIGRDYTIYSKIDGVVSFDWGFKKRKMISVKPVGAK